MSRIIRSDYCITIRSGCFKSGLFYMAMAAFTVAGTAWMLKNIIPFLEEELLSELLGEGKIDFGLLRFESVSEIEGMTPESLLKISYSGYVAVMLAGIFAIESFGSDFSNGFFGFLTVKRISRKKIYCAKICSTFLAALLLFWGYGGMMIVLAQILFGRISFDFRAFPDCLLFLFVQSVVLFSVVSLYSLLMCTVRHGVSAVLSCLFLSAGMPVLLRSISVLLRMPMLNLVWIGNCSAEYRAGDYEKAPVILLIAVLYGIGTLCTGAMVFQRREIE